MRLRKSKDNELYFCKKIGKDIHGFSFRKFMEYMIKEVEAENDDSEEGEDDIDDDLGQEVSENDYVSDDQNRPEKIQ